MAQVPRQVPWFDWNEWNYVKIGLFEQPASREGGQPEHDTIGRFHNRMAALEIVRLWRARGGLLPHSVDATAHFSELNMIDTAAAYSSHDAAAAAVVVDDAISETETTKMNRLTKKKSSLLESNNYRSEIELRLMYTMAIVRSINGLADPGQQGIYAESVLSLVSSRGLPAWIVEIRHDGTHNSLPTLQVLRAASSILMKWYYKNYWEVQGENIPDLPVSKLVQSKESTSMYENSNDNEINNTHIEKAKRCQLSGNNDEQLVKEKKRKFGNARISENGDTHFLLCPLGVMQGQKSLDLYKLVIVPDGARRRDAEAGGGTDAEERRM